MTSGSFQSWSRLGQLCCAINKAATGHCQYHHLLFQLTKRDMTMSSFLQQLILTPYSNIISPNATIPTTEKIKLKKKHHNQLTSESPRHRFPVARQDVARKLPGTDLTVSLTNPLDRWPPSAKRRRLSDQLTNNAAHIMVNNLDAPPTTRAATFQQAKIRQSGCVKVPSGHQ